MHVSFATLTDFYMRDNGVANVKFGIARDCNDTGKLELGNSWAAHSEGYD